MQQNLKSLRAREQNMFEWHQEPCQPRDTTDKASLVQSDTQPDKTLKFKK